MRGPLFIFIFIIIVFLPDMSRTEELNGNIQSQLILNFEKTVEVNLQNGKQVIGILSEIGKESIVIKDLDSDGTAFVKKGDIEAVSYFYDEKITISSAHPVHKYYGCTARMIIKNIAPFKCELGSIKEGNIYYIMLHNGIGVSSCYTPRSDVVKIEVFPARKKFITRRRSNLFR